MGICAVQGKRDRGEQRNYGPSKFRTLISKYTRFLSSCLLGLSSKCTLPTLLNRITSIFYFLFTLSSPNTGPPFNLLWGNQGPSPCLPQCRHLIAGNRTIWKLPYKLLVPPQTATLVIKAHPRVSNVSIALQLHIIKFAKSAFIDGGISPSPDTTPSNI